MNGIEAMKDVMERARELTISLTVADSGSVLVAVSQQNKGCHSHRPPSPRTMAKRVSSRGSEIGWGRLSARPPPNSRLPGRPLARSLSSVSGRPPGSYGVRFVKPFFQHLVVSSCWKGRERRLVMLVSLRRARSQTWLRSDPRLVPFISGPTWPASSYPAEREALNHHALVRQGRGTKAAGPNLCNVVEA
jgi:hypothetical protein